MTPYEKEMLDLRRREVIALERHIDTAICRTGQHRYYGKPRKVRGYGGDYQGKHVCIVCKRTKYTPWPY